MDKKAVAHLPVGLYMILTVDSDVYELAWGPDSDGDFYKLLADPTDTMCVDVTEVEAYRAVYCADPGNKDDADHFWETARGPATMSLTKENAAGLLEDLAKPRQVKPPMPNGVGATVSCRYSAVSGSEGDAIAVYFGEGVTWAIRVSATMHTRTGTWEGLKGPIEIISHGAGCTCAGPH